MHSNPRPALCGASSFLSAYEKSHHETVMAKFNFTANFARPQGGLSFCRYDYTDFACSRWICELAEAKVICVAVPGVAGTRSRTSPFR